MAMDSVETLVAHVQALSGNPEDVSNLHSLLKQSEDSLRSQASRLFSFLEQLDPSKHSLGYLYLLEAYSSGSILGEQASGYLLTAVEFINFCSAEQIRLAPDKFISVCKSFKDQVMQLQVAIRGVAPLRTAIRKLQTSSEHLTTLHPDFLLLCLLSKCYKAGLSILDDDIFEVDQPRDLFLYCYYGGMINIGLKRFHKALECLHNVVTAPMTALNAIAVEAFKKYVLVSLIHNGQVCLLSSLFHIFFKRQILVQSKVRLLDTRPRIGGILVQCCYARYKVMPPCQNLVNPHTVYLFGFGTTWYTWYAPILTGMAYHAANTLT